MEPSSSASKLRLMVSYNGQILPRPNHHTLFYSGGDTRIISLHRRSAAASFSAFSTFLSKTLFKSRPFKLKYLLPSEDLDSLISVSTDEDLLNMLDEHDRLEASRSASPHRLRLFLFPVKPDEDSPRSHPCFSDESLVFETGSSFGSTGSSVSMSNLSSVVVQDGGVAFGDSKGRVSSSASIQSDTSIASLGVQPKPVAFQEPVRHVASGGPIFTIEPENTLAEPSTMVHLQKPVQLSGYQLPQQSDGKQHQPEFQYMQGSTSYIPQYSAAPLHPTSYYPFYQIPVQQQQKDSYPVNQPYPVYYYPVHPVQSYNMPMHSNVIHSQNMASSRPPLHPHTATVLPHVVHKETLTVQPSSDSAGGFQGTVQSETSRDSVLSGQDQQPMPPPEHVQPSQSVPAAIMDITNNLTELDDDIAYTQIYKTQPSVPLLPPHYPVHTVNSSVVMSDSSKQQMNAKPLSTAHPQ